ncbi:MAG TPA: hypothetical protein VHM30_18485 [Gemmatimonadaceae bacterium]|nr:hypothetical protein [Gemmatimonadaceae bacterium]
MSEAAVLFTRDLPGGGFVAIESLPAEEGIHRARVSVERRSDPGRRLGHLPPVIATLEGPSRTAIFEELYRIAVDNVAIARGIMRWQAARRRDGGRSDAVGKDHGEGEET